MTSYDDILDLALVSIEDYRLDKVAIESPAEFKLILEGFMIRGLSNFDNCVKDLSDRNEVEHKFNVQLDELEKSIIADWTAIMWLDKEINDTRQITAMLQNRNEAHRYSEANNLKAKADRRVQMTEDVKHKQTMYSLKHVDWKGWANGNYEL
jgi:hypothetical protein|nr:MAG TPA: hypothetical protein [Caudoviricetes sp.]